MEKREILKVLSDETRYKIVELLKKNEYLTAGEIATSCEQSNSNISHHLNVLKDHNIILPQKHGQYIRYRLFMDPSMLEVGEETNPSLEDTYKEKLQTIIKKMTDIALNKKCEPVWQTDSQEKGTFIIRNEYDEVLKMTYTFSLPYTFSYTIEKPFYADEVSVLYAEKEDMESVYNLLRAILNVHVPEERDFCKPSIEEVSHVLYKTYMEHPNYPRTHNPFSNEEQKKDVPLILRFLFNHPKLIKLYTEKEIDTIIEKVESRIMGDSEIAHFLQSETQTLTLSKSEISHDKDAVDMIKRIARFCGKDLDKNASVEGSLPNGHRVIIKKTQDRTYEMVLRKGKKLLTLKELLDKRTINQDMKRFLEAVSSAGNLSIGIVGLTGSGKTNVLHALVQNTPSNKNIAVPENSLESALRESLKEKRIITLDEKTKERIAFQEYKSDYVLVIEELRTLDDLTSIANHHRNKTNEQTGTYFKMHGKSNEEAIERMLSVLIPNEPKELQVKDVIKSIDLLIHVERQGKSFRVTDITHVSERTNRLNVESIFTYSKEKEFVYTGYDFSSLVHQLGDMDSSYDLQNLLDELQSSYRNEVKLNEQLVETFHHFISQDTYSTYKHYFELVMELNIQPLSRQMSLMYNKMEAGMRLKDALLDSKREVHSSDWDFFANGSCVLLHSGGPLKNMYTVLKEREEMRMVWSDKDRATFEQTDVWTVIEVIDLLRLACNEHHHSIEEVFSTVKEYVPPLYQERMSVFLGMVASGNPVKESLDACNHESLPREWQKLIEQIRISIVFQTPIRKVFELEGNKLRRLAQLEQEIKRR